MRSLGIQPTRKAAKDAKLGPRKVESKHHATSKPVIKLTSKPMPPGRQSIAARMNNKRLLSISRAKGQTR